MGILDQWRVDSELIRPQLGEGGAISTVLRDRYVEAGWHGVTMLRVFVCALSRDVCTQI